MGENKGKWGVVVAAMSIHLSIGSIYAWSVFTKPIMQELKWSLTEVSLVFSLAILFLGLSASFSGHLIARIGSKRALVLSTMLFTNGMIGTGLAINLESLPLVYLFFGFLGGIGLGIGYITPISLVIQLFPTKRGLSSGVAIMGFGLAAVIASPVMQALILHIGIANTFFFMGIVYFVIMFTASMYISSPKKLEIESGSDVQQEKFPRQLIRTKRFYYLWILLFLNILCGIAILSIFSPLTQEKFRISAAEAASLIGIISVFNGLGRLLWSTLSDFIGRPHTYLFLFITQFITFLFLLIGVGSPLFYILVSIVMVCYGGGFASLPAYISDIFGVKHTGIVHGYMLTAWAAAGLIGPILTSWLRETTGGYTLSLFFFSVFMGVAIILSLLLKRDLKRREKEEDQTLSSTVNL
ncbi:L-lactate MFS transporter [Priestia koreensis]|uniref:L-lactate MFS transporter n=1 Tax=Priestia koreensis TaxID=284581 RepID=UPI001F5A9ECA|nr:OFA family MFS transporter [Priestia koreensis]UNL86505.1 OFA family MFS transporter [Priestia koreensis]